mmetsp:Transcript_14069/g.33719  ORF Transcript_14069/g.33719 Transcript_14069/m.33719 type:complete len:302 (+) Transcript_14069:183-1088(+)
MRDAIGAGVAGLEVGERLVGPLVGIRVGDLDQNQSHRMSVDSMAKIATTQHNYNKYNNLPGRTGRAPIHLVNVEVILVVIWHARSTASNAHPHKTGVAGKVILLLAVRHILATIRRQAELMALLQGKGNLAGKTVRRPEQSIFAHRALFILRDLNGTGGTCGRTSGAGSGRNCGILGAAFHNHTSRTRRRLTQLILNGHGNRIQSGLQAGIGDKEKCFRVAHRIIVQHRNQLLCGWVGVAAAIKNGIQVALGNGIGFTIDAGTRRGKCWLCLIVSSNFDIGLCQASFNVRWSGGILAHLVQ